MIHMTEGELKSFMHDADTNWQGSWEASTLREAKKRGWIVPSAIEQARKSVLMMTARSCEPMQIVITQEDFKQKIQDWKFAYSELEAENKKLREEK